MSLNYKIGASVTSSDFSSGYSTYYYQFSQPSIDPGNEGSKKKWRKILKLTEEELLQAIKKFGPKVRDIRLGLRITEPE